METHINGINRITPRPVPLKVDVMIDGFMDMNTRLMASVLSELPKFENNPNQF